MQKTVSYFGAPPHHMIPSRDNVLPISGQGVSRVGGPGCACGGVGVLHANDDDTYTTQAENRGTPNAFRQRVIKT